MEFNFSLARLFPDEITCVNGDFVRRFTSSRFGTDKDQFEDVINTMGNASAKAQGLSGAITTPDRLRSGDQRAYMIRSSTSPNCMVGLLKVGIKRLFLFDVKGHQRECEPLCVLDFYVHESMQRQGCGKRLFEHMLMWERTYPDNLAYDRPSDKLMGFLRKHYNLHPPIPQRNAYVVFSQFFSAHNRCFVPRRVSSSMNRKSSGHLNYNEILTSRENHSKDTNHHRQSDGFSSNKENGLPPEPLVNSSSHKQSSLNSNTDFMDALLHNLQNKALHDIKSDGDHHHDQNNFSSNNVISHGNNVQQQHTLQPPSKSKNQSSFGQPPDDEVGNPERMFGQKPDHSPFQQNEIPISRNINSRNARSSSVYGNFYPEKPNKPFESPLASARRLKQRRFLTDFAIPEEDKPDDSLLDEQSLVRVGYGADEEIREVPTSIALNGQLKSSHPTMNCLPKYGRHDDDDNRGPAAQSKNDDCSGAYVINHALEDNIQLEQDPLKPVISSGPTGRHQQIPNGFGDHSFPGDSSQEKRPAISANPINRLPPVGLRHGNTNGGAMLTQTRSDFQDPRVLEQYRMRSTSQRGGKAKVTTAAVLSRQNTANRIFGGGDGRGEDSSASGANNAAPRQHKRNSSVTRLW